MLKLDTVGRAQIKKTISPGSGYTSGVRATNRDRGMMWGLKQGKRLVLLIVMEAKQERVKVISITRLV
jgi:hypothetical protein